jgi:hypothetical protein
MQNLYTKKYFKRDEQEELLQEAAGDITVQVYNMIGLIQKVQDTQVKALGQIFFRPKSDGSLRLIYDMRPLNVDYPAPEFKLINPLSIVADECKYFIKIDLANAFYHFRLNNEFANSFCFMWKEEKYRWNVLPFGFSRGSYY